jgi:hypothetical protein
MTRENGKTAQKRSPRKKYPVEWDKPRLPVRGGLRLTGRPFPRPGKPSAAIYDYFEADPGDGTNFLAFYTKLFREAVEVFVWTGKPSPEERREVLDSAMKYGAVVVVHTTPKHARSMKSTVARTVRTDNRTGLNFPEKSNVKRT